MTPLGIDVVIAVAFAGLVPRAWLAERHDRARAWAMIALSAIVLGYWQLLGLVITLALTAITWLVIRGVPALPPAWRPRATALGVFGLLAVLVGFVYVPWLASLLGGGMDDGRRPWIVPLGLSFTVFRLIGAIFDSVALRSSVSATRLLLLSLFFPTYRAGPIETLQTLTPLRPEAPEGHSVGWALARIFRGLCRKLILADPLYALVISPWLAQGIENLSPAQCVLLPLCFSYRIYWDFAGYSDIAIGTAGVLGYRVRENFDRPYLSRSVVEFWSRWHITLSEWIRIRLFMKMVGRRSSKRQVYAATVVSMALCGLWHGAGANFLVWGLWHGVGLVGVHLFGEAQRRNPTLRRRAARPAATAAFIGLTFAFVTLGWVAFFLPLDRGWLLLTRALAWRPGEGEYGWLPLLVLPAVAVAGAIAAWPRAVWPRLPVLVRGSALSGLAAILAYLLFYHAPGTQEFIYAQF